MTKNMDKIIKLILKVYHNHQGSDVYDKYILINTLAEELKKECQLELGINNE